MRIILPLVLALSLSGCATAMVASAVGGAVVGVAGATAKYAVKGTVGVAKLAYKGTKAAVKGTAKLVTPDQKPATDIADDYNKLPGVDD